MTAPISDTTIRTALEAIQIGIDNYGGLHPTPERIKAYDMLLAAKNELLAALEGKGEVMTQEGREIIRVEYFSDTLGRGIFWEGPPEIIFDIHNLPARRLAIKVLHDGITRTEGMWIVSKVKKELLAALEGENDAD